MIPPSIYESFQSDLITPLHVSKIAVTLVLLDQHLYNGFTDYYYGHLV
jgi:hypothetical protein